MTKELLFVIFIGIIFLCIILAIRKELPCFMSLHRWHYWKPYNSRRETKWSKMCLNCFTSRHDLKEKPNPECTICKGSGNNKETERSRKCNCVK